MDFPSEVKEDNSDNAKNMEKETIPLNIDAIINNNDIDKKNMKCNMNYKSYLKILYLIIASIMIFVMIRFQNFIKLRKKSNFLPPSIAHKEKAEKEAGREEEEEKEAEKNENIINTNKKGIGFLYSSLFGNGIGRFMTVTGNYFVKKGYNVYFLTKPEYYRDFKYNKKIKRMYVYNNSTLLKETLKSGIIDFLIVANAFDKDTIEYYKSFGLKVIGVYHGVFISLMYNNSTSIYRSWKNLEYHDAFIHLSPDDYYFYNSFGFKRNIFIPNLYTFEPSEVPSSNLTNHNIMMLGRLNDKKKGVLYALKAMYYIIKEVPDAQLNLVSSDNRVKEFKNLSIDLNLTNNVNFLPYTEKISDYFLNSSVFFFTSLTEAFPMALNEAKAYGLPCVTFDVSYSVPYQSGVIKVENFDYKGLAREVIKLLKDYDYRIKMGKEAKLSLNSFTNEGTINLWERLFKSLKSGENEFQKLRKEIMEKYYNKEIAEKHLEKQIEYLKMYNKFFKCHSLKNLTDMNYLNNIEKCNVG